MCLETGEVEWMKLEGNSNSGTSAAFLNQLRQRRSGQLNVIWDNAPGASWGGGAGVSADARAAAAAGEPPFSRGQALPGYSPDFNADEAIWGWARESLPSVKTGEATGNLCLGTKALVQQRGGNFLAGLVSRRDEVRRRCRTVLQSRAEALLPDSQPDSRRPANAHPTLALV